MYRKITTWALAMLLASPSSVGAHALWINMTDWTPVIKEKQAKTRLYVGWGHHYPVDGITRPGDFASLSLITPGGMPETFSFDHDGISTAQLTPDRPGLYTVSIVRHPSWNTIHLQNGKEIKEKGPKTAFRNVVKSIYSQQFATSYFAVGDTRHDPIPTPVGNRLELVPLVNPYDGTVCSGGKLPIQLRLDGKPLPYTTITATYAGYRSDNEMAIHTLTDANGVAHIRISHPGPWLFKARAERAAQGEIAKSATHEVYYTSLTLRIEQ